MNRISTIYIGQQDISQSELDYFFNSFNIHYAYVQFLQKNNRYFYDELSTNGGIPIFLSINEKNFYISNQFIATKFEQFLNKNKCLDINIHSLYCETIL